MSTTGFNEAVDPYNATYTALTEGKPSWKAGYKCITINGQSALEYLKTSQMSWGDYFNFMFGIGNFSATKIAEVLKNDKMIAGIRFRFFSNVEKAPRSKEDLKSAIEKNVKAALRSVAKLFAPEDIAFYIVGDIPPTEKPRLSEQNAKAARGILDFAQGKATKEAKNAEAFLSRVSGSSAFDILYPLLCEACCVPPGQQTHPELVHQLPAILSKLYDKLPRYGISKEFLALVLRSLKPHIEAWQKNLETRAKAANMSTGRLIDAEGLRSDIDLVDHFLSTTPHFDNPEKFAAYVTKVHNAAARVSSDLKTLQISIFGECRYITEVEAYIEESANKLLASLEKTPAFQDAKKDLDEATRKLKAASTYSDICSAYAECEKREEDLLNLLPKRSYGEPVTLYKAKETFAQTAAVEARSAKREARAKILNTKEGLTILENGTRILQQYVDQFKKMTPQQQREMLLSNAFAQELRKAIGEDVPSGIYDRFMDKIFEKEERLAAMEGFPKGTSENAQVYVDMIVDAITRSLLSLSGEASDSTSAITTEKNTPVFNQSRKILQRKFPGLSGEDAGRMEGEILQYQQHFSELLVRPMKKHEQTLKADLRMVTYEMWSMFASKIDNCKDAEQAIQHAIDDAKRIGKKKLLPSLGDALKAVQGARHALESWKEKILTHIDKSGQAQLDDSRASVAQKKQAMHLQNSLTPEITQELLTDPDLTEAMDQFSKLRDAMTTLPTDLFTLPKPTCKHAGIRGLINQTVAMVSNVILQALQSTPHSEPKCREALLKHLGTLVKDDTHQTKI
jgi:hypothetical protein